MTLALTPSQTVGPYLRIALLVEESAHVVPPQTPGAVTISGQLLDGAGEPVPDGMIETWQADPDGRFAHPDDPRGAVASGTPGFRGHGRSCTEEDGSWHVVTVVPGALPTPDGAMEAPHLDVSVFARGMLDRVVTRIYFPEDDAALAADPVLRGVPESRRPTLVARPANGGYRFDIHLQGPDETVFFDV